jgi:spore maturation protein CgeB
MASELNFIYAYSDFLSQSYEKSNRYYALAYIERLNSSGFHVQGFNLTLSPPGPALSWPELDRKWKAKDKTLMATYQNLLNALGNSKILINASGINLHPEFVDAIPNLKFFQCFDDPENSKNLSKPVAYSYDMCLVGNAAEVETYRNWGAKKAIWQPLGLQPELFDSQLSVDDVNSKSLKSRSNSIVLIADFLYSKRKSRLGNLIDAFPQGSFYGPGSPLGFLPQEKFVPLMRSSQIGLNIHNSTGPINARTFYLPGNGVMQICDNKSHLALAFEPGLEIIGVDSIDEMIHYAHYYAKNTDEQREIALAGWQRARKEYTEPAVFQKIANYASELYILQNTNKSRVSAIEIRNRVKYSKYFKVIELMISLKSNLLTLLISVYQPLKKLKWKLRKL